MNNIKLSDDQMIEAVLYIESDLLYEICVGISMEITVERLGLTMSEFNMKNELHNQMSEDLIEPLKQSILNTLSDIALGKREVPEVSVERARKARDMAYSSRSIDDYMREAMADIPEEDHKNFINTINSEMSTNAKQVLKDIQHN